MKKQDEIIGYAFVVADLLHVGHLRFLEQCKQYCDCLIVGIYTDELTMTYKRKPVIPYEERLELVKALRCVDEVIKVTERSCIPALKQLEKQGRKITFLFHGDDWDIKKDSDLKESKEYIESIGGKFIQPPYTKGASTSIIVNRILNRIKGILDREWNAG